MKSLINVSVVAVAALVLGMIAVNTSAGAINYTETFATTGSFTGTDGSALQYYPDWTYYEDPSSGNSSNARVDAPGTLVLAIGGNPGQTSSLYALVTASTIAGTPNFDVSVHPLTVSGDIGGSEGNELAPGNVHVSLVVGNLKFLFHPGFSGSAGSGYHRVQTLNEATTFVNNADLGFATVYDTKYATSVTIVANGLNYDISYSIGSYSNAISVAIADVGNIDRVGFEVSGLFDTNGDFGNFAVSQIPEPATLALLGLGAVGTLLRRRK